MPRRTRGIGRSIARCLAGGLWLVSVAAAAYGPEGHLIAGRAAEPLLCARAAAEVARLGGGVDLGELGLWADRIRSDPAWRDSGPWHYMNIADGVPLEDFLHPPEGDVLDAIARYSRQLGDRNLDDATRADALRFLVHFVADLHQPLHVGLEEDRGGNSIELEFRGETTNLHRYWDTHAIEGADLSLRDYLAGLETLPVPAAAGELDPLVWASESLALRAAVYDFGRAGREPRAAYLRSAVATTQARLLLASRRMAGTLNALLCD